MTIKRYVIYIAFIAALFIAWKHRESIENNIARKVNHVRKKSPYIDDRIGGEINSALHR